MASTTETARAKFIDLSIFDHPQTSAQWLQRTADYALDPLDYLTRTLGAPAVSARQHLLSLPTAAAPLPLQNDFYGSGTHKSRFEAHIAALLGKRHALFFATGVQAQSVAFRAHADAAGRHVVAWHATAHPEIAELSGITTLFGLRRLLLGGDDAEERLPTAADVEALVRLPLEERPAAVLMEVPHAALGCATPAFSELEAMSRACRAAGVAFHCDGARLWEVAPHYETTAGKSLADIAALFDSVYVSFFKGLAGAAGAMLVSDDAELMLAAWVWQRRAGGNPYTCAYELIDCERGFNENIGTFEAKLAKAKEVVESVTKATARFQTDGQAIVGFLPEVPTCCIVRIQVHGYSTSELNAARDKVLERTGVKVFNAMRLTGQKKTTFDEILQEKWRADLATDDGSTEGIKTQPDSAQEEKGTHRTVMFFRDTEGIKIDTAVYVDAWVSLCEELASGTAV
jgi:threonine aldolase